MDRLSWSLNPILGEMWKHRPFSLISTSTMRRYLNQRGLASKMSASPF